MSIINDRIKERRIQAGLTLLQVADKLGVKEATAQRYESGEIKNIKHETIILLSEIFNCSPAYLMGWNENVLAQNKTNDKIPFNINCHEINVITAYHNQPEMQPAVDKILGVEKNNKIRIAPAPIELPVKEEPQQPKYNFTYFDNIPVCAGNGYYSMDIANATTIELTNPPPKDANYLIKISGDSMEPTIHNGDKIFIK